MNASIVETLIDVFFGMRREVVVGDSWRQGGADGMAAALEPGFQRLLESAA